MEILTSKVTLTHQTNFTPQLFSIRVKLIEIWLRGIPSSDQMEFHKKAKPSINIPHPSSLGAHPPENTMHEWTDQLGVVLAFLVHRVSMVEHLLV